MSEQEEWTDLVGKTGEEAREVISKSNPNLTIQIIPDGSMVTMDYVTERVRIFVDSEGKVVRPPRMG